MKGIKVIAVAGIAAMSLLTAGCAEEPVIGYIQEGTGSLRIPFEVDGEMPVTRATAVAVAHEKRIEKVNLLFFDKEAGNFVTHMEVPVGDGGTTVNIDPPEVLTVGTAFKVLAVGNADAFCVNTNQTFKQYIEDLSGNGYNYSEMMGKLKARYESVITHSEAEGLRTDVDKLPLFGTFRRVDADGNVLPQDTTFTIIKSGNNKAIKEGDKAKFFFKRSVCRFDLVNLCSNNLDIQYVRVVNSPDGGYYFADGVIGGEIPEYAPADASDEASRKKFGYVSMNASGEGQASAQKLTNKLYGFPNVVNTTIVNDGKTTALLIAGYYIDDEGNKESKLTYYRFNLANLGESQVLNRNTCYQAIIKGVNGRGNDNETDAFHSEAPHFKYEVDETWDTTGDNVVSDDEGNFMILSRTRFTFPGNVTEADYFELKVSTNPELKWKVEADNTIIGHENNLFELTELKDATGKNIGVKCRPKEENNTAYVRYGYFNVIGTNPKTGKTLQKMIYLTQLSNQSDIKMLTVDGQLGTIEYELDPNGDELKLPVVTGTKGNIWTASDVGASFAAWGQISEGYDFTREGDNNNILNIKVAANLSGERTAELNVQLKTADDNVKPVTIILKQKKCDHYFDIIGLPEDGSPIIIKGSDWSDQGIAWAKAHPNGYCQDVKSVRLQLTSGAYACEVTHTFDNKRDFKIGLSDRRYSTKDYDVCSHPGSSTPMLKYYVDENGEKQLMPNWTNDDNIRKCGNGDMIYLNAFLMGPGDPMIDGTVTVRCYDPANSEITLEQRSFKVRIRPDDNYKIDDVVEYSNNYVWVIADRNYGCTPRVQAGQKSPNTALYYTNLKKIYITGLSYQPYEQAQKGTAGEALTLQTADSQFSISSSVSDVIWQWEEDNKLNNKLYEHDYEPARPWRFFSSAIFDIYKPLQLKCRAYFISNLRKKTGEAVLCPIPYLSSYGSTDFAECSVYFCTDMSFKSGYVRACSFDEFGSHQFDVLYTSSSQLVFVGNALARVYREFPPSTIDEIKEIYDLGQSIPE